MSQRMENQHKGKEDHELLEAYSLAVCAKAELYKALDALEDEIHSRMRDRRAISIPSEKFVCEIKHQNQYDQLSFTPLKEIFNPMDLEHCWAPKYEETRVVPERWDTVKVLATARRYGGPALDVVSRAMSDGKPKLVFKPRDGRRVYSPETPELE